MNIGDYSKAFAQSLLPVIPGGQAITILITQPVVQTWKQGIEAGKRYLGISEAKELYPLLTDAFKGTKPKKNREIALATEQDQIPTQKEIVRAINQQRVAELEELAIEQARIIKQQQKEYEQRAAQQREQTKTAETERQETRKQEDKHQCAGKCERNSLLLLLAQRYGIYIEKDFLSLSTGDLFQKIVARAKHNVLGLMSFAKENPSLGLDREIIQLARGSIQDGLKELVGNDTQLGNPYINQDAKLGFYGQTLSQA